CRFSGNEAENMGGAVFSVNRSNGTYLNCLFSGNRAKEAGGAFYNNSSNMEVVYCTIVANYSSLAGGSIYNYGSVSLKIINSIIWGNSSSINQVANSTLTINNSIIQSETLSEKGTDNLNEDPLFVDPVSSSNTPNTSGNY